MDQFFSWLGMASAALLVVAVAVAWWEHRKRMAEIRRQLAWSENSRFAMEEHVREVDVRMQAMSVALESQQQALTGARDPSKRKDLVSQTLQRMSTPPQTSGSAGSAPHPATVADATKPAAPDKAAAEARPTEWPDTLPMVLNTGTAPGHDAARPADLQRH